MSNSPAIHFTVLTLFPDLVRTYAEHSITGRALAQGLFELDTINIRDFADNPYGKVDDTLYGGGTGMLMMCQPVWEAWQKAVKQAQGRKTRTIFFSPKGRVLNQEIVNELAGEEELILLCGHYEGIDERVLQAVGAEELSIGNYVLTGGELAANIVIDAVARQQPGILPDRDAFEDESLYHTSLECRQYTKPETWQGQSVPAVLLSGHHAKIREWRRLDGWAQTLEKRKDLFAKLDLTEEQLLTLADFIKENRNASSQY